MGSSIHVQLYSTSTSTTGIRSRSTFKKDFQNGRSEHTLAYHTNLKEHSTDHGPDKTGQLRQLVLTTYT